MNDDLMGLARDCLRGTIVAAPGKKLVVADLANIEGRVAAWVTGEAWKVQAFRDYDGGVGPDLYKLSYARAFDVPLEAVGDAYERQIGKVMELMLQYEGGVGAFVTGSETYSIDLDEMARRALPALPQGAVGEARDFLRWLRDMNGNTYELSDDAFVACDAIKRVWRAKHPKLSAIWKDLQGCCVAAIHNPGVYFDVNEHLRVRFSGAWLRIFLPSGRVLCYPSPRVFESHGRESINFMGVDQFTKQWRRVKSYGGKLFENCIQSLARDVLADNMPLVEEAGMPIVLSVHDELITEVDDHRRDLTGDRLGELMSHVPDWATGLPLAAKGFETFVYEKR